MSNAFHEYLCEQLGKHLLARRIVVFYDPRREFEPFFEELERVSPGRGGLPRVLLPGVPDPTPHLARFEGSFFGLRAAVEPIAGLDQPEYLIIYLPGVARDRKGSVLMELEKGGLCYEPQLKRLARSFLRRSYTDGAIDELLGSERVTYQDIVRFLEQTAEDGGRPSVLRGIFDNVANEELLARWLADPGRDGAVVEKGAAGELVKLIGARLGLVLDPEMPLAGVRERTIRYLLANELRADLEGEPPVGLVLIQAPATGEQLGRIRKLASLLRKDHWLAYESLADKVERDLGLRAADVAAEDLRAVDTFRFQERALFSRAGELIARKDFGKALQVIPRALGSPWVERNLGRRAQWEACRLMAELGQAVVEVGREVSRVASGSRADPARWVKEYARPEGWHRVDLHQRRLEAWIAKMDDTPELEQALAFVRRLHEELLGRMADGFSEALITAGWQVPEVLHQTRVYAEVVEAMVGRVAYFLVDAMRYEMGVELAQSLEQCQEVMVRPAIVALPSITSVGMAALLPGAASSFSVVEHKGALAVRIGEGILSTSNERMKHFRAVRPDLREIALGKLLQRSTSSLQRLLKNATLLVVRSQSIDGLGEMDGGLVARQVMDTVVGNIARAVRRLARLGFDAFVITADHGHQFSTRKGEDMLLDRPGGRTVEQHRRCWAGQGGRASPACIRVTGSELGYDTDLDFIFPRGLAVFRSAGGLAFHHGGISLQEIVAPVVSLRAPCQATAPGADLKVHFVKPPQEITNRTFAVSLSVHGRLFGKAPVLMRVALISEGEEVGRAGMAVNAEFDRATGLLRVTPGQVATVGLILTRDDCETVRVVVQDPATDALLTRTDKIPVKLRI
jgi:hypothetical protein